MEKVLVVQGRELDERSLEDIHQLIASRPSGTRWTISRELCEQWNWRTESGQLKDMACRSMLKKLHDRGLIHLPAKDQRPRRQEQDHSGELHFDPIVPEAIHGKLDELQPLSVEMVPRRGPSAGFVRSLLAEQHYLGFRTHVGETVSYLVRDRQGRALACAVFGAAAWKIAPRDAFIGWDAATRARNLTRIANNSRYLILPWVEVPHLASHILGLLVRRLRGDWLERYGHPLALLETFVDRNRFRGTCYRAANWRLVGCTQGRSRQDRYSTMSVPIKDIYLYPLTKFFRQELTR